MGGGVRIQLGEDPSARPVLDFRKYRAQTLRKGEIKKLSSWAGSISCDPPEGASARGGGRKSSDRKVGLEGQGQNRAGKGNCGAGVYEE